MAMLRKKIIRESRVQGCSPHAQLSRASSTLSAHGPPALSTLGPGGVQLRPLWISGLWPASEPRPAQQGEPRTSGPNEENPHFLLSEGQKRLQISDDDGRWQPGPLGPPRDAPGDVHPLAHRALLCRLEHNPPGPTAHGTPSAAGRPGPLFGVGDGRGRIHPGDAGPYTGREEVLPWHPSLPEGEEIQPLCLGSCQSGNHEILLLNNNLARKHKK